MATQADLDALNAKINSGQLTVRYSDGRIVTYRSLDEMLRIKASLEAELGVATSARTNVHVTSHNRGF